MRLKRISVSGLFGVFDHEISLDNSQRVTIITVQTVSVRLSCLE